MATRTRKSQLRRCLSLALPGALVAAAVVAPLYAQYQPSGYQPLAGEPFFLLSDKAYGSGETAKVRLEVASAEFGMSQVETYGGVDVVLYRVPQPLPFLSKQKNLHRISVEPVVAEEGLANTLAHLWDRWYQATRRAWRAVFSGRARGEVIRQAPELRTSRGFESPTEFQHPPQFKPLAGFELITRFRYPVHRAASIRPPSDVRLAGSSSEWIKESAGNVLIPLGRLRPGLYLVEAYVGSHRATTLLFASDTLAITKTSSSQMVVWTANRTTGVPVGNVKVSWTDGVGVLQSGPTDSSGLARFAHAVPERSYVYGSDPAGGVFISENFYYDSEIYGTKVYAVTDRPLYRPGDQVFVKLFARDFESARLSRAVVAGDVALVVYDPGGVPVANQRLKLQPGTGGDTSFRIPENASAGGYELRFTYRDAEYSAAFRVAEYQKPHFEITVVTDKADFKAGEAVTGRLQLHYADGKPVKGAEIQLSVRSQQLTTVDGELRYYGQFPVKLESETLHSDARGEAPFSLPAAEEPSRFLLTALATDGAAYRVRTTREILVERGENSFVMRGEPQFSAPRDAVVFSIQASGVPGPAPVSWDWVRQEDRKRVAGHLATPNTLTLTFPEPGSYSVHLRDARGRVVAAASHWVSGPGLKPPAGTIEIVTSKEKYRAGETAELLITLPTAVDDALLTLERDRVEQATTLKRAAQWVTLKQLGPTQWQARLPVGSTFAPNITFSILYVKDGEHVFQNQGLIVAQPTIDVQFRTAKQVYLPGETVEVTVRTTMAGKPVPATLAVGVVDEMIYALQPEIAPPIYDFFFHARRNNVRTAASQDFISYDLSMSRSKSAAAPRTINERRIKVLERARRDETDTAFWNPTLVTSAAGVARFSFKMPDALSRWRITGRALSADGTVGQKVSYLRSDKDLYAKWTSPTWMRQGDAPIATLALFNQTAAPVKAELQVSGAGLSRKDVLTLRPGVTYVDQPLAGVRRDAVIAIGLKRGGRLVDSLETRFASTPRAWPSPHSASVSVGKGGARLDLPSDAREIRARLAPTAPDEFLRVIDDLLEYPYGCIEQTSSRMIPFSLAVESIASRDRRIGEGLRQQLNGQRLRLAYMANPKGRFTWWGPMTREDPFLTAYGYYADWFASRALGINLPPDHWNRLLDVYSEGGAALAPVHRALFLHFMQEMNLPVKSLVQDFLEDLDKRSAPMGVRGPGRGLQEDSVLMEDTGSPLGTAFAFGLADRLAHVAAIPLTPGLQRSVERANQVLRNRPAGEALLVLNGRLPRTDAARILGAIRAEMPTIERALALAWIRDALTGPRGSTAASAGLRAPWVKETTASGGTVWRWPSTSPPPKHLQLATASPSPVNAIVQFESASAPNSELPVRLERQLYRVVKAKEEGYQLQPVDERTPLSTGELYLDELVITPESNAQVRFAIVEVPLPPGATVDSTTWGITVPGAEDKLEGLEMARHQPTRFGYVVPLDGAAGATRIRHLLRFAQKGAYSLPRARLYRMYLPGAKAIEPGPPERRMEVR